MYRTPETRRHWSSKLYEIISDQDAEKDGMLRVIDESGETRSRIANMPRKLEDLAAEALELSVDSRAAFAKALLDSLDELSPEEQEALWVNEAAERYEALVDDRLKASPSAEVLSRLEARTRR